MYSVIIMLDLTLHLFSDLIEHGGLYEMILLFLRTTYMHVCSYKLRGG
jgi:hypothetical protein